MKLQLEFNAKVIQDPTRDLLERGIGVTPPIDADFWLLRVPVSSKQAVVGFPKFSLIGVGFQVEAKDWNTNLPTNCTAEEIYEHIKINKGPGPKQDDCIEAIRMIQSFVHELNRKPVLEPARV